MGKKFICLDIGGTKVLGAVFDENNNILFKTKKKTRVEKGIDKVEEKIVSVIENLIEGSGIKNEEIAGIAAGAPGVINEDTGEILFAPNLPWRNYDIKSIIENKFKVPFFLGNDANVGMIGEWKYGAAVNKGSVIGVFVGTGIGGGLIINNKLFSGARHLAGELGHMVLNTEGPLCNCGQRGCLEAYSSKIAITRELRAGIDMGMPTVLADILAEEKGVIESSDLKKAVLQGDRLAISTLQRAAYYLTAGIGNLINIFNPEIVILGGGVVEALEEEVLSLVKSNIGRFAWPHMLSRTRIRAAELKDDAVLYGARALISEILGY